MRRRAIFTGPWVAIDLSQHSCGGGFELGRCTSRSAPFTTASFSAMRAPMLRRHRGNGLSLIPSATGGIARLAYEQLRSAGVDPTPVILGAGVSVLELEDRKCRLGASAQAKVLEL